MEEADAEPVVLDQVKSADLKYDEEGMLEGSVDKHGILTSEATLLQAGVNCFTGKWHVPGAALHKSMTIWYYM